MSKSRKGSNHHMTLTRHRERYQDYCQCCANYRTLKRYPTDDYYCHTCTIAINKELGKKNFNPKQLGQYDRKQLLEAIDIVVTDIAASMPQRKVTKKDFLRKRS